MGESDLPRASFAMLLRNDEGGRNFTDVTNETLPALAACQHTDCVMEWGDFDGDQRVDLFVSAWLGASTVYLNNGNQPATFTEVDVSATFAGVILVSYGEARAGDFDGDGKDDLAWVMNNSSGLYRSNGDGTFTDVTKSIMAEGSTLPPLSQSSADWGDVNGDQRLDLAVCGRASTLGRTFSAVFVQTEEGQFRDSTAELFPGDLLPQVYGCAVRFVDFDGDALLDLAITGVDTVGYIDYGALLRNNGVIFEDVTDVEFSSPPPLPLQFGNRMEWVDVDGNRSPDFSSFNSDGVFLQRNTRAFPEDESSSSSSSSSQPSSSSSTSSSPESNESDDEDDDLWWQVTVPVVVVVLVALCVVALLVVMLVNRKKKKRKQKSKSEQLL
ncbi:VCBS repeat-containing protein [Balamuthia mandrillaris]